MNIISKNESNQGTDQQSVCRERAYCDEGTEIDLRWGFRVAEFSIAGTPASREAREFLLAQITGNILSAWEADSVDSAVAGSIPW